MNRFRVPFKVATLVLATALVVLLGLVNVRERLSTIDPTDGIYWVESRDGLTAGEVFPEGAGAKAGVRPGDRLAAVDGKPIHNLGDYADELYSRQPGDTATYSLESDGSRRDERLRIAGRSRFAPADGLRTFLAFIHLVIGFWVLARAPRVPRAVHFYWVCLSAFVVYLYSYGAGWSVLDRWVYALSIGSFLALPAVFVHFALRFPSDESAGANRLVLVYFPALGLGLLHAAWLTGHLARLGFPIDAATSQLFDRVHLVYFSGNFGIAAAMLLRRRAKVQGWVERQQMKWVSYGTIAGIVPFTVFYGFPYLFGARPGFVLTSSILFLALLPLSFAYAVVRFRLNDVEAITRRSASYVAASTVLLAAYVVLVLVAGRALERVVPDAGFFVVSAAALAVALLFAPLRDRIQEHFDRYFYRDRFQERATVLEFARTLSSEVSLPVLGQSVVERVSRTFDVPAVALYVHNPVPAPAYSLLASCGLGSREREVDSLPEAEVGESTLEKIGPRAGGSTLAAVGLTLRQTLWVRGRTVGLLAMEPPPLQRELTTEDRELLSALARYVAIALENARLYQSVENKAEELERLKAYTENILESINVAVLALDPEGKVTSCNKAFETLLEVARSEVTGRPVEEWLDGDVVASIRSASGSEGWNIRSAAHIFKLAIESRGSRPLIVNLSVIPLLEAFRDWSGCLLVMEDISEKIQLEDQIQQVEKLSSLGLLAAGIAHEVNTPITGISSYAQMLLKETPDSDARRKLLEKIEKQSFRASEIVNGLLNFARLNGSEFSDLDLNQLIRDSLALIEHQMRQNGITVKTSLEETIPTVYGNAGRLQQVFVNLFMNARDAMPSGGRLEVRTAMNDSMVIVDVTDSGVGISPENIKRIYDPFFTTKSTGKGTGLGLAVTYGILQDHGGRIFVESERGHGTSFRIKLPTRELPKR